MKLLAKGKYNLPLQLSVQTSETFERIANLQLYNCHIICTNYNCVTNKLVSSELNKGFFSVGITEMITDIYLVSLRL